MKGVLGLTPTATHDLVVLDPDHPGFRDAQYRKRRNEIAAIALAHRTGDPVPDAPYTAEEQAVWRQIRDALAPLHTTSACAQIQALSAAFPLERSRIPQLSELNPRLEAATGFRMEPVAGLVEARAFLRMLGRRVFLSTQYIRHHSRPMYTPEPDVVHELVGHAATLAHPGIAEANRRIGLAAEVATPEQMVRVESVYWYVMEFGVVDEGGPKAFGAGLLSSAGELSRFATEAELRPWDLDRVASTPYDPTQYQPALYVAPSFERLLADVVAWTEDAVAPKAAAG